MAASTEWSDGLGGWPERGLEMSDDADANLFQRRPAVSHQHCLFCNELPGACLCLTRLFSQQSEQEQEPPASTPLHPSGKRDEAATGAAGDPMETAHQPVLLAAHHDPFDNNYIPYTSAFEQPAMTDPHTSLPEVGADRSLAEINGTETQPQTTRPRDMHYGHTQRHNSQDMEAANILYNGTANVGAVNGDLPTLPDGQLMQPYDGAVEQVDDFNDGFDSTDPNMQYYENLVIADELEQNDTTRQAFAKLHFKDGDYYINTHDVTIGRNRELHNKLRKEKRRVEKAKASLESYRKEPSQPSQPGDQDLHRHGSSSNQSLQGHIPQPSAASELGGAVYYESPADAEEGSRRKRRSFQYGHSSSANSVAPANLHAKPMDVTDPGALDENGEPLVRTHAFVPVHTADERDMRFISKEHLTISYNFETQAWDLHVLSNNGVYINDSDAPFPRGTVVPIDHDDVIQVSTLEFTFKLPDNFRQSPRLSMGTFDEGLVGSSEASDLEIGTSPARRLSNAIDNDEDEEDDETTKARVKKSGLKIKLKRGSKSKGKDKGKQPAGGKSLPKVEPAAKRTKKGSPDSPTPEEGAKAGKGKKPKAAAKEPAAADSAAQKSPTEPPQIDPTSALAHIPVNELPAKRKGPGRPPKNGLVSKRDQALVNKKLKEYEKRGEKPPTFDALVQMVRQENKLKDQANKQQANGVLPADGSVMPSIEGDNGILASSTAGPSMEVVGHSTPLGTEPARRSSPRPKRTAKSPSPMLPKEHFTEEQLKKPAKTYLYMLNDLLEEHPDGQADLQEIYDRIQKKYPYYKYGLEGNGWQSSVRHNLLQHDRFMEVGKSGKGKYWAINKDVPLEREKKRRMTPPPRAGMINGQFLPGQQVMTQAQYGNPYGQQAPPQGQSQPGQGYYPPYNGGAYPPPPQGQNITYPRPSQQRGQAHLHANANRPPPAPAAPAGRLQPLVDGIMQLRQQYLGPSMVNGVVDKTKEAIFGTVVTAMSNWYHGGMTAPMPVFEGAAEKEVADPLAVLMKKFEHLADKSGGNANGAGSSNANGNANANAQQAGSQTPQQQQGEGSVQQHVGQATVDVRTNAGQATGGAHEAFAGPAPVDMQQMNAVQTNGAQIYQQQLPVQQQPPVQQPAPAVQAPVQMSGSSPAAAPVASAGTKRAAEDEQDAGADAKRVKTE